MTGIHKVGTLVLLAGLLTGCTLQNLREETREFYSATVLVGHVSAPAGWTGPVIVAAVNADAARPAIAHRIWLHEPGGYELIVAAGSYRVMAYGDRDGNGRIDAGDPAALMATPVQASDQGIITGLDLRLAAENHDAVARVLPRAAAPATHSTQIGALADLDAAAFSAESGRRGYWSPLAAFRQTGGNVYFLEPYDPGREPVLFIHGAAGSAQDFRYLFDHLDRSRYQAWFFQYPSGAPLDSMANLLFWKLLNLQLRFGFERVNVVAHSMGGLVARRFLLNHGSQFPQVKQLITISTPWGGERSATTGVEHSPAVIPSWRDMQPEGDFLKALFAQPLPPTVRHTLLFGHRGGYNLLRPTTDGTVTLASQLRPDAQAQAALVMGYDEDHVSILEAPAVLDQVSRQLRTASNGNADTGRLQVELTYTNPDILPSASAPPFLVLTTGTSAPQILPLPSRTGISSGLAPGEYDLQLLAHGFRCEPARQRVSVTSQGVTPVALRLVPQGVLANYVAEDGDAITYPAGGLRPPHATVVIEAISLRGAGIHRTLVPERDTREVWREYLEGRDAAAGAAFSFVDLPTGEYALEIRARGYRPYRATYQVSPGVPPPAAPIVLRRQ